MARSRVVACHITKPLSSCWSNSLRLSLSSAAVDEGSVYSCTKATLALVIWPDHTSLVCVPLPVILNYQSQLVNSSPLLASCIISLSLWLIVNSPVCSENVTCHVSYLICSSVLLQPRGKCQWAVIRYSYIYSRTMLSDSTP